MSYLCFNYVSLVFFYLLLTLYYIVYYNYSYFSLLSFSSMYFSVGSVNFLFILLVLLVFLFIYIIEYSNSSSVFLFILSLISFSISLFYSLSSLLYVFVFFEFSFFLIYLIIIVWGYNPERVEAVSYFLIYSFCGSLPVFFVITLIYVMVDASVYYDSIFFVVRYFYNYYCLGLGWFILFYFLIVILGFFIKFPVWGLHSWLPKAHVEAPVVGSVLLAALMVKLGVYGILRYFSSLYGLFFIGYTFSFFFVYLCFSVFMSNYSTIRQFDNKSFIAYSSVVHMALISLTFWSGSYLSLFSSLILSFSHGLISFGLFFCSGYMFSISKSRSFYLNRGYLFVYSFFVLFLTLLLVFNCSFPFSLGFFSELVFIYLSSNVTVFSYFFMFINVFFCGFYCVFFYLLVSIGFSTHTISFSYTSDSGLYLGLFFMCFISFFTLLLLNSLTI